MHVHAVHQLVWHDSLYWQCGWACVFLVWLLVCWQGGVLLGGQRCFRKGAQAPFKGPCASSAPALLLITILCVLVVESCGGWLSEAGRRSKLELDVSVGGFVGRGRAKVTTLGL